jgi:hypothetical protein
MIHTVTRTSAVRVLLVPLILLSACAVGSAGRSKPARQARADDGDLERSAVRAVADGDLERFATGLEDELAGAVARPKEVRGPEAERVTRLAAFHEFGRFFSRVERLDKQSEQTLEWLVTQPRLMPVMMMAVTDADDPGGVLAVLGALHEDQGDRLDEFPDLTAAFCVVWDRSLEPAPADKADERDPKRGPGRRGVRVYQSTGDREAAGNGQEDRGGAGGAGGAADDEPPDVARAVQLFRYYTNAKSDLQFNPRDLPWQLAVYVVDNMLADDEIVWAVNQYRAKGRSVAGAYFDVNYDLNVFFGGKARRGGGRKYTLQNLKKFGGVCTDQAYYAAQVAKAMGVPSAVAKGQGGAGRGAHAWVGFLQTSGKQVAWNFNQGRYESHLYWAGAVRDPQTHRTLTDADVSLLAELQHTDSTERLASVALCKAAGLDALARDHRAVADLYRAAIDLSPGNRAAWMGLADMAADGRLGARDAQAFAEVVNRFAQKNYPDFAFAVLRRTVAGSDPRDQLDALARIGRSFGDRPDLAAAAAVAQGDLHREAGRDEDALRAYDEVFTQHMQAGPVVLTAMDRVDALLRDRDELKQLAGIYKKVWAKMTVPDTSAFVTTTPFYVLGARYAELLKTMGDERGEKGVRARLASLERMK